jgi:hypothetical protein
MYLLLVTNKQSNILEDLDTLRLLAKVVPEYCGVRARAAPARRAPLAAGRGMRLSRAARKGCAAYPRLLFLHCRAR